MTDVAWIGTALTAARPQAMAALLRYFRDLDLAEEAFQNACLRAVRTWALNGRPRDPVAWLVFVARNAALDDLRKRRREAPLPDNDWSEGAESTEAELVERMDESHYRDDLLRLLFVCCHPDLPATQQIALALRIVAGLTVKEIARAFLVGEAAMEQRITRAKRRIAAAGVPFETPGPAERSERLAAVAAALYLLFNEGYSASGGGAHIRTALCEEAIRLVRILLRMFPAEPELMGLCALMLLQQSRAAARLDAEGSIVPLEEQDRARWDRWLIAEALALLDKALRHRQPGPYQLQAALAAVHARSASPAETDWAELDRLYAALEIVQPSPVVSLNRAVAVAKLRGPADALAFIEPLAEPLAAYFHYYGLRGALLTELGRCSEARDAFGRAISLAGTPAEADHIRRHLDRLTMRDRDHGA